MMLEFRVLTLEQVRQVQVDPLDLRSFLMMSQSGRDHHRLEVVHLGSDLRHEEGTCNHLAHVCVELRTVVRARISDSSTESA